MVSQTAVSVTEAVEEKMLSFDLDHPTQQPNLARVC